nr:uncharacterized protein LOC106843761 isoform X2 [Equus asinus]
MHSSVLVFSGHVCRCLPALCLPLWPFSTGLTVPRPPFPSPESKDDVLVIHVEAWRRCGSVALDPKDGAWSCCGLHYPFHRPSQRCCWTKGKEFLVIPRDDTNSESDDCRRHSRSG